MRQKRLAASLFDVPVVRSEIRPGRAKVTGWVARTIAEVEAIRPLWNELQEGAFTTDPDVFMANLRHNPEVARPHVVVLEHDGKQAIVAGRLLHQPRKHRIGRLRLRGPHVPVVEVVYQGVLHGDASLASVALAELRRSVDEREAAAIVLRSVVQGSELANAIQSDVPRYLRSGEPRKTVRRLLDLPRSLDELLAARPAKLRENVRRCIRRVEAELGEELELHVLRSPDDYAEIFATVDEVASRSRRRGWQPIFAASELERRLVELGLAKGWFRAYVLLRAGEPLAFWTGYAYGGTFGWRGATGYDDRLRSLGVGTYCLVRMLDDLCLDPSISVFDFGLDEARYKRMFTDRFHVEETMHVYGRGRRAARLHLNESVLNCAKRLGYRFSRAS
jgi:CelD/BcsL family acetyltransferase involved in cellulose biosynthesis